MIKSIGCCILGILIFHNIYGQNNNDYFKDAASFPDRIAELVKSNVTSEEAGQLSDFTDAWKRNTFSDSEKVEIVKFSNALYARKARNTQFKILVRLLFIAKNSDKNVVNYPIIIHFLENYISQTSNTLNSLNDFMLSIINVIFKNFLHNTTMLKWQFSNSNYTFRVQNNVFSILFSGGDLTCYSKNDSIAIKGTSGVYFPTEQQWLGDNGTVTWERAGFKAQDVNAKLGHYHIDLDRVEYTADSVTFSYPKYFEHPVLGKLTDKVMNIHRPESAEYPEFNSYSKRFSLKGLYENIDYDGGFTIKGAKIIGSGDDKEDAKITVKKGSKVLMVVKSKYFVFRPERINGINTIVKINLGHDSIYHNDLSFIYFVKTKEVDLLRTDEYSSLSPYYNSYHKIDMDFEQLTWRIDQPRINMTMARGASMGRASFQSENYYNQLQYEKLQGMDAVHPLVALRNFSRLIKSLKFSSTSYADYIGRPLYEVRQELMAMAQNGFIYYDSQADIVTIKQRIFNYLNASFALIDYDVINFISTTQAPQENASLDMNTYDLYINGIQKIAVSDSQNVIIYPARQQIIMKENRSFQFDGKVEAGLFTFYGSNFFFNYKDFTVNLQNVDSVSINVLTGEHDNYGRPLIHRVQNVIQHLTGEIQVDRPDNKSGRKHIPGFPRFESRATSYVYYQNKSIEGGVYPEESFYFEVAPFVLDSLENISKHGLAFNGTLQSSGILPPVKQVLRLQPDYSLGFQFNPGPDGIPVYGGKGKLFADINLSNKGLRGNGKLSYLTSTTTAKDFKFYPDSMNVQSQEFEIKEQTANVQYPYVYSTGNYIHWVTGDNKMFIAKGETPFTMFTADNKLYGSLVLEPKGVSGTGKMDMTAAEINSRLFTYKAKIFDADTSQFLLKSLTKKGYTVLTEDNVKSHIDFSQQKGEFTANGDYTKVDFPENKYISFLDYFKWNMDKKTLDMGSRKTTSGRTKNNEKARFDEKFGFAEEPTGPRYISVNPNQDSLNFVAPVASYDYQNDFINADDVKLIRVADAIIYPKDGKVTVAEAAQMRTIFDCKVVANDTDRLHTIHSANINIQGRQSFTGTGKYDYVDETGAVQTITMNEIKVDTDLHTIARANMLETDSFSLSPYFKYQGKITLSSVKPLLTFDGAAQPVLDCENLKPSWLKFTSEIDPKDVYIPVGDKPLNVNDNKIYAGILMGSDSIHIYPAFLSGRRNYNDSYIQTSSGYLHYNHDSMVFEIASKEKMQSRDSSGNYLCIHKSNCIEYGEGVINLGVSLGQVKLASYGSIRYNLVSKAVTLDAILGIDFMLDPASVKIMTNQVDSFPDLTTADTQRPLFIRSLNETLGRAEAGVYLNDTTKGKPKAIPLEIQHTLNLTYLQLKWNELTNSYQSVGKIGIGNILNTPINRMVDGYVEITRKRSGDYMDIYLKLDDNNYYYFGYAHSVMQVFSTNTAFVANIRKLSINQRTMDLPKSETPYIFMVSSDTKFSNFLRRYNRHLEGNLPDQQDMQAETPTDAQVKGTDLPEATQPEADKKQGQEKSK